MGHVTQEIIADGIYVATINVLALEAPEHFKNVPWRCGTKESFIRGKENAAIALRQLFPTSRFAVYGRLHLTGEINGLDEQYWILDAQLRLTQKDINFCKLRGISLHKALDLMKIVRRVGQID